LLPDDVAEPLEAYDDGRGLEMRTNVLLGATAIAATVTLLIAVFTDWSGGSEQEAEAGWLLAPSVGHDGGALLFTSHF
jgi:hypothetical protein